MPTTSRRTTTPISRQIQGSKETEESDSGDSFHDRSEVTTQGKPWVLIVAKLLQHYFVEFFILIWSDLFAVFPSCVGIGLSNLLIRHLLLLFLGGPEAPSFRVYHP